MLKDLINAEKTECGHLFSFICAVFFRPSDITLAKVTTSLAISNLSLFNIFKLGSIEYMMSSSFD